MTPRAVSVLIRQAPFRISILRSFALSLTEKAVPVICQLSCAGLSGLLAQISRSRHEPARLILCRHMIGEQTCSFRHTFSPRFAAGDRLPVRSARLSDGTSCY